MDKKEIEYLEDLKEKHEGISFLQSRMPSDDDDPKLVNVSVAMTDKHWIGKDLLIYIFPFDSDSEDSEDVEEKGE